MAESERRPDYERSDASPRLVAALTAGLATALIALPLTLAALYPSLLRVGGPAPVLEPPQPRLQAAPRSDLATLRRAEDGRLNSYGVDPGGTAHIPIEQAMELLVTRGLPGWPKP